MTAAFFVVGCVMQTGLESKTVVITGASGGIGGALVRGFAEKPWAIPYGELTILGDDEE